MSDLSEGLKALANSAPAYSAAEHYYTGTVGEYFSSAKIATAAGKAGSSFRLNFSAIAVDARVDRMEVASLSVPGDEKLSEILRAVVYEANELDVDLPHFIRRACMFGDYYLLVWPGADDEGLEHGVDIYGNSPLNMRVMYDVENTRRARYAVKAWEGADGRARATLYYRDRVEEYILKAGVKKATEAKDFEPYLGPDADNPEEWPIANPYGRLPVFHLRPGGKPYGVPVHARTYGAQDAINKLTSTHMSAIDYAGWPLRYALLDDGAETVEGVDDFIEFDTSGVVDGDKELKSSDLVRKNSNLKTGPAETWFLSGVKSVGQFETAEGAVFLEPLEFQVRAMARLSGTPLYEFDLEGNAPSGESRRRAEGPLMASLKNLKRSLGQPIEAAASFGLEILGHPGQVVVLKWAPSEIASARDDWETIGLRVEHGVPLRVALAEAGYTEDEILEWYPEGEPAISPALLAKLGGSLVQFSQAVTLGTATADTLVAAFPMLDLGVRAEPEPDLEAIVDEDPTGSPVLEDLELERLRVETLGVQADLTGKLIRAGVAQDAAASVAGLDGLPFDSIPTTIRPTNAEAAKFEEA